MHQQITFNERTDKFITRWLKRVHFIMRHKYFITNDSFTWRWVSMPSLAFRANCVSDSMIRKGEALLIIALFVASFNYLTNDMATFLFGKSGSNIWDRRLVPGTETFSSNSVFPCNDRHSISNYSMKYSLRMLCSMLFTTLFRLS